MSTNITHPRSALTALALAAACAAAPATAQPQAQSNIKPPQAQAWIDVATYSGMGMPMGGAAGNPISALGDDACLLRCAR